MSIVRAKRKVRHPLERADCPTCGKDVALTFPRGGNGLSRRVRAHKDSTGGRCDGIGRRVSRWRDE